MKLNLKVLLAILFFILLTVTGYLIYLLKNSSPTPQTSQGTIPLQTSSSPTPLAAGPTQKFTGKIVCLPLKSGVPETIDSCALGLLDDSGKYYMLFGLTEQIFPEENARVEIQGGLIQNFFGSGGETVNYSYEVTGGIQVSSIRKI